MFEYNAIITEVYDGDTVTANVNLGFHITINVKCRLYGINTPEVRSDNKINAIKSRDRLRELILNKSVIIKTHKDKTEKYGRWLADIFIDTNSASVNEILISEGLAIKYIL